MGGHGKIDTNGRVILAYENLWRIQKSQGTRNISQRVGTRLKKWEKSQSEGCLAETKKDGDKTRKFTPQGA